MGATEPENKNSVAIVTGVGGDIGRAIAVAMLEAGHSVLAADIVPDAARSLASELEGYGGRIVPLACDVTDEISVRELARTSRELGPLAVLVNNAGGVTRPSLHSMDVAGWRKDIELNLNGAFICFHALAEELKAGAGCVVNIASVNGMGTFGHPAYSAAKAGLIQFTRMIAVEYGKFGVRANAVAPGTVRTSAWEERAKSNPDIFEHARRWYPLGRLARTTDVADAVKFLAGPEAGAITGICLPVDCGLLAGQAELARTFSQSGDY